MQHSFKKGFGQNFLKTSKYALKLIEPLEISINDTVIEIGPGDGSITSRLLQTGAKVICIEIDYDLLSKLLRRFQHNDNFNLIHADFMKFDLNSLELEGKTNLKVVGALPYNISKQIIEKLLLYSVDTLARYKIEKMSFIVQEEVSRLYVEQAPESNPLSIWSNIFARVQKKESIATQHFIPQPKVKGGILLFNMINSELNFKQSLEFQKLIKIGFSSPRKKLIGNIKNSGQYSADLSSIFKRYNIDENSRPAELDYYHWLMIFKELAY